MPGMLKRPAVTAGNSAPPAKEAKVAETEITGPIGKVLGGIEQADIPQSAKSMLRDMLEGSLGILEEERDRYQMQVVDMVGEVLVGAELALQKRVDEVDSMIVESEKQIQEREEEAEAKGRVIDAKNENVKEKKRFLAEVAERFKGARANAATAKIACSTTDGEVTDAVKHKEQLEGMRSELLRPLTEGSVEAAQLQDHIESLVKKLAPFNMAESLTTALPSTLSKAPGARGSFDVMVLTSTEAALGERLTTVERTIRDAEPTKAARNAAHLEAEALLEKTTQEQVDAAAAFKKERSEEAGLERELDGLRKGIKTHKEGMRKHRRDRAKAEKELAIFRDGPIDVYAMMKSTQVPKPMETRVEGETATSTA